MNSKIELWSSVVAVTSRYTPTTLALSRHSGFSLIEILISLAIFSFSALSLIALQIKITQNTHQTYLTTHAMVLLQDMAERIRSNRESAKTAAYVIGDDEYTAIDCTTTLCTSLDMARYEKQQWMVLVKSQLPNAIIKNQYSNNRYVLTLYWYTPSAESACQENIKDTNNCLSLEVFL